MESVLSEKEIRRAGSDTWSALSHLGSLLKGVYFFVHAVFRHKVAWVLGAIFLFVLPYYISDYASYQIAQALAFTVIVLGLNVLVGYTGQISLGHGAFVAVGAYVTALGMQANIFGQNIPFPIAMFIGGIVCAIFGALFGFPCTKLEGPYLALATEGLAISTPLIIKSKYLSDYTKGIDGLTITQPEPPAWGIEWLTLEKWQYYTILLCALAAILFTRNLLRGPVGRAFFALRDNNAGAEASGINVRRYKIYGFALSSFLGGLGGGMIVFLTGFVRYDNFGLQESINYLMVAVFGGLATIDGSVIGGVFLAYQNQINEHFAKWLPNGQYMGTAVFGAIVVVIMSFSKQLQGGVAQGLRRIDRELRAP